MSAARPLFQPAAGDRDVRPLAERLPAVTAPRPALAIAAAAPVPRPLFGAPAPVHAAPAAPAGPDPAIVERELAAARAEAERAGRAAAAAEVEAVLGRYAASMRSLDRAVVQATRPAVDEVIELAMIVAREIIGRELSKDRAHIATAIESAIVETGEDGQGAIVRVNPDDLAYIQGHDAERFAAVELVADPKLAPGGCVVETARAIVDASIEARMAAVRRAVASALAPEPGA